MRINLKRPGWVWLEHASENAAGAAAMAAGAVLGTQQYLHLHDVPWDVILTAALLGAFGSYLKSVSTLWVGPGENNGTASLNPRVVAAPKSGP
jgi:hypothetical protein